MIKYKISCSISLKLSLLRQKNTGTWGVNTLIFIFAVLLLQKMLNRLPFLSNVRWILYVSFYFYFALCSKIFSENVRKPINKNKRPKGGK